MADVYIGFQTKILAGSHLLVSVFTKSTWTFFSPDSYRLSLPAIILPHVWVVS